MRFSLFMLFALTFSACQSVVVDSQSQTKVVFPKRAYSFYSGSPQVYGDLFCKRVSFKHPETEKVITLQGMIHVGDYDFYKGIEQEVNAHDFVLSEGVGGNRDLDFSFLFFPYVFSLYDRGAHALGLSLQMGVLDVPDCKDINADLSLNELSRAGTFSSSLAQFISVPFLALLIEPTFLCMDTNDLMTVRGKTQLELYAMRRHLFLADVEKSEDNSAADKVIPGILTLRNDRLLEVFDEEIIKPEVNSLLIPWGALHLPEIQKGIEERGYLKVSEQWDVAVSVNKLFSEPVAESPPHRKLNLPYIYSYYNYDNFSQHNLLFRSIKLLDSEDSSSFQLLYGQLMTSYNSPEHRYFSLLPQLFGHPLLFDYESTSEKISARWLLFFHFTHTFQKVIPNASK